MSETVREYGADEYFLRFQAECCPRCKSRKVKLFTREKGGCSLRYRVYICAKCKIVLRREAC